MSFYNKLEEIFIVYRRVHLLNIKKCNNGVYIQPANLSFNKHLLLVENSPIDKHRWKMELISCFSENKQTILILFDYKYFNVIISHSDFILFLSGKGVKSIHDITKQKIKLLIFRFFYKNWIILKLAVLINKWTGWYMYVSEFVCDIYYFAFSFFLKKWDVYFSNLLTFEFCVFFLF